MSRRTTTEEDECHSHSHLVVAIDFYVITTGNSVIYYNIGGRIEKSFKLFD